MPRTKQNHPKNLKDKIEEAQKELKDPKVSQKGPRESGRRLAEAKGLKRKKVVGENQLKKVPKSPVKPLQAKSSVPSGTSGKEASRCSSFPSSPSRNSPIQNDAPDNIPYVGSTPLEGQPLKGRATTPTLTIHEGPMQTEICVDQQLSLAPGNAGKSPEGDPKGTLLKDGCASASPSRSSAPLEVLLKAMEPDFTSLTEQKSNFTVTQICSAGPVLAAQSSGPGGPAAMPAVGYSVLKQPALMQPELASRQQYYSRVPQAVQVGGQAVGQAAALARPQHQQPSSCVTAPDFSRLAPQQHCEEHAAVQMYGAVPAASLIHTPVPSGPKTLPQSQPVVYTCQSASASVPSTVQVPVTPGYNQIQMAAIVTPSLEPACNTSAKDQKPKKQGKYVCEFCNRACAKPSVLLKHKRSHTGERPYPCITCDFSFKTKSNLYKHKKSHAHAIKLGLVVRSDSGPGALSQESDKALSAHSDVDESADSDKESVADLDPDSSQSSTRALSESSAQSVSRARCSHEEAELPAAFQASKSATNQKASEPKVTGTLPKVVVHPVNVSPLRADSPRVTDPTPELVTAQWQREFQAMNMRSNVMVLSSVKEVDCTSPSQEVIISEDEEQHCKSPPGGGHAQLQRQQATDFSQQQQGKCLLSPRSLGSTDSGYFSRSESADQAMSPPSPFVKISPPVDMDVSKNPSACSANIVATVMQATFRDKSSLSHGQMRPPLVSKALSLEERISKLISDNEAVVDDKQLDSVKPKRTSLSRRGSIDSPKSYIFKDSFQFDLKPIGRRSSSSSDIPKSPFTPTDKSKQVFLLSVPHQYPSMDCLPITRSNSMPTTPGYSAPPHNAAPLPHPLRVCQSFDDKIGSVNDDVFISAPATPNPVMHPRTLVRQIAIEDFSSTEGHGLAATRSMDEGYHGSNVCTEVLQRSKSFEQGPAAERNKRAQQNKGTMYECETCRNRYRKLENFENHKKFYCSELHGPKNKSVPVREMDQDQSLRAAPQPQVFHQRAVGVAGIIDQAISIRKRRKMKSVGDDDDQSPTDTNPPCSGSFDSCQMTKDVRGGLFSQHSVLVDLQSSNNPSQLSQMQLMARGVDVAESRLSPIREAQISVSNKERGDLQRQGSGTSVIRHTNSLSRPSSFETSESIDRASPVDLLEREAQSKSKPMAAATASSPRESPSVPAPINKPVEGERVVPEQHADSTSANPPENCVPAQQSRLVRQNNIQVPEILVTEEPDREQETQVHEPERPLETFNWPQRSESLSKLPTEKLPPKKKRIRLAQMEQSSGESSFDSSLSRSLSRDSSLSRCSSVSASFDREELPRPESPSRTECVSKTAEFQGLPLVCNTLGVPDSRVMRRAASEQISCTQPSGEITTDYRSKSFDCGTVSPMRSLSPRENVLPKSPQPSSGVQVPLIERRRGPLVRPMSLKIGPESQQAAGKQAMSVHRVPSANINPISQHRSATRPVIAQPLITHQVGPLELIQQKNFPLVQGINLGSQTEHPVIHGLPHPWHQTTRIAACQRAPKPSVQAVAGQEDPPKISADSLDKNLVPKYQLHCSAFKNTQKYSLPGTQATKISLPIITLPVANEVVGVSKPTDRMQNVYVVPQSPQMLPNPAASIMLPICLQGSVSSSSRVGVSPLPQILVTHEQLNNSSAAACRGRPSPIHIMESDVTLPQIYPDRLQTSISPWLNCSSIPDSLRSIGCNQAAPLMDVVGSTSPMALCLQQEPSASSKRMLSPANSLDIAMEKHQKRVKDEHGGACLTDGRSLSYLGSKVADVPRQRKLVLVRQVCTVEPADSPGSSEGPQQEPEKTEAQKAHATDTQTSSTSKSMGPVPEIEAPRVVVSQVSGSAFHASPSPSASPLPANSTLKSLGKSEERWSPGKSPARPLSFHGQMKLASSVSVVNTRDSHRLSFPSLKTTTTITWCYLMKRKPLHVPQDDQKISAYSTWAVGTQNPNPLGLPTKVVMSLLDSKQTAKKTHYTQAITTSLKSDILTYSSKLKDSLPKCYSQVLTSQTSTSKEGTSKGKPDSQLSNESDRDSSSSKTEPRRVKIFDGGYKSNEEYVYVRGRGRGKYICEECGIRCKKPSMLRKHIRTHSDVRPYHCAHCNFSFKTKGNLTKHMKSKAHSKKCLEMGVSVGLIEDTDAEDSGDRGRLGGGERPGSDVEDSDGPEDDDNDAEEDDEDDSQAESSLSAAPSVSASPLHFSDAPPSALLAQMSLSGTSPCPTTTPASDGHTSDTDSVPMMSPVSPCRQMSIDYPDSELPPSPPVKGMAKGQDFLNTPQTGEAGFPVDRGTQTSLQPCSAYVSPGPLHFLPQSQIPENPHTHLFSHLPPHSQQPSRTPYSMVPVGGIQLVPGGLAAYSTFLPIQAGSVQLTIPAVSVLHRNPSPLPALRPDGLSEPVGSGVLSCLPLGQVGMTGLEALNMVGLPPAQLIPQSGLALGLQVLAASPAHQGSTSPQAHIPSLQILNIALPALISSLSPRVPASDTLGSGPSPTEAEPPVSTGTKATVSQPSTATPVPEEAAPGSDRAGKTVEQDGVVTLAQQRPLSSSPDGTTPAVQSPPTGDASKPGAPRPSALSRQQVTVDDNDASSDDEDRLVIAT